MTIPNIPPSVRPAEMNMRLKYLNYKNFPDFLCSTESIIHITHTHIMNREYVCNMLSGVLHSIECL